MCVTAAPVALFIVAATWLLPLGCTRLSAVRNDSIASSATCAGKPSIHKAASAICFASTAWVMSPFFQHCTA